MKAAEQQDAEDMRWIGELRADEDGCESSTGARPGLRDQQGLACGVEVGEQLGSATGVGDMGDCLLPAPRNRAITGCVSGRG